MFNPLLLIQLPDRRRRDFRDYEQEIENLLRENHNITVDNGKLAVYLSENKENLENLTKNDNEAEVMLFKQAIALGWDCPRASILCLFRDWRNFTFSTQTLGRILRMPELKHYDDEQLNTAFVYTTTGDLSVLEEAAGDYVTIQFSQRQDFYQSLTLLSVHSKRRRELTRFSPVFNQCFLDASKEMKLAESIDLDQRTVLRDLVTDGEIEAVDQDIAHLQEGGERDGYFGDVTQVAVNVKELQRVFDQFAAGSLSPDFYPEPESVGRVKESIYQFFGINFNGQFKKYDSEIQKIVLDDHNRQLFIDLVNHAKEKYTQEVDQVSRELISRENWEVPVGHNFNLHYVRKDYEKSVMQPFFERDDASQVEKDFAQFLDSHNNVKWWFKNGEQLEKFLAVPYEIDEETRLFYLDWVVQFEDGRVGLFDTKGGITAASPETKAKAEGLQQYIREENEKGKKLIGGIVIKDDDSWRVNGNPEIFL